MITIFWRLLTISGEQNWLHTYLLKQQALPTKFSCQKLLIFTPFLAELFSKNLCNNTGFDFMTFYVVT
jgi:hypothetical protein